MLVIRILGHDGLDRDERRAAYAQVPLGGLFRPGDLEQAEGLLVEAGLVVRFDERLEPTALGRLLQETSEQAAVGMLTTRLLESRRPLWLRVPDTSARAALMPDGDAFVLETAFPDPVHREAVLLSLGMKFEYEQLRELGILGELAVVNACRILLNEINPPLSSGVAHVSLASDALGYDVSSPTTTGSVARMEVKTTMSAKHPRVYLSRNEAEVGLRDEGWALVVCCAKIDAPTEILGWCRAQDLAAELPQDCGKEGMWATAVLALSPAMLTPGLPL